MPRLFLPAHCKGGRCFRVVDFLSDGSSKLIAIDEEPDHEIVHGRRFGKADRATHKPLDPCAEVDVLACDLLRVRFADHVLLRGEMPLVGAPSISVKAGDTKRFEQCFQLEKYLVLAPSKDIRYHGPTGVINRMPEPPWLRFRAHATPHLIELGRQTSALRHLVSATQCNLSLRWG